MNTEKITVHKALAELKTLDDRIQSTIANGNYVVGIKHTAEKINGVTIADYREAVKKDYQKVTDLITRRNALKKALVLSNAVTKITVGGTEYTVAEAIELKNHGMENKRYLRDVMTKAYNRALCDINLNSGEALEKRAEQYVLSVVQAQPKDSKMSVDSDAMKALRQSYIENNTFDLIDPIGTKEKIEALTNEIDEFNTEVDAALSVSNALTVIEFEY